jgi:choline dehydrogenase-like flavoprotein
VSTDVVVIGTGPSGASAADRLVRAGLDVTVLEAGRGAPRGAILRLRGGTVFRWIDRPMASDRHVATGDPRTVWFSSTSLGGLSNYWTAAVPRMHPRDFVDGGRIDERYVWPIGYDDLRHHYDVVERHLDITAGAPIDGVPPGLVRYPYRLPRSWADLTSSWSEHGFASGALPMAKGSPNLLAGQATGWTSQRAILHPIRHFPNYHLRLGAQAVRLTWNASERRVEAVDYLDAVSGELRTIRCRAVVVAAGALDSTRLLLQSTSSDFPNGLGNTDGIVGRYLSDHPREWWPVTLSKPLRLLVHPVYIARPSHDALPPLMSSSHTLGMVGKVSRVKGWVGGTSRAVGVQTFGSMVPQESVSVRLTACDDPVAAALAPLEIDVAYDDQAKQNMTVASDRLRGAFASTGIDVTLDAEDRVLEPGRSVHFAGTLRMHRDRRYGVVDEWNRVYDAPNVAVVDMACFTTNPEKNPTLTAMAIAARAADHLAAELGGRVPALELGRGDST